MLFCFARITSFQIVAWVSCGLPKISFSYHVEFGLLFDCA
ncbi:hypothetical protein HMPREF1573_00778 [Gardnerella vaginalis JCP7276]|nr:hypothetical protein HMPREF1573_00778 [Gardnerella vaginalis JCP7276]